MPYYVPAEQIVRGFDTGTWYRGLDPNPAVYSANRKHAFVLTRQGDVACDCNLFTLFVYDLVGARPRLIRRLMLSSDASDKPAITLPRWYGDDEVLFLGADASGILQVKKLDLRTGETSQLTTASRGIISYDFANGSLVVLAEAERDRSTANLGYPARPIGPDQIAEGLSFFRRKYETLISYHGGALRRVIPPKYLSPLDWRAWMSPDGEQAIVLDEFRSDAIPETWQKYHADFSNTNVLNSLAAEAGTKKERMTGLVLVDAQTAAVVPMISSPTGKAVGVPFPEERALWPGDGTVILVNTTLPIAGAESEHSAYVASVDLQTGRTTPLSRIAADVFSSYPRPSTAEWVTPGRSFRINFVDKDRLPSTGLVFDRQRDGSWVSYPREPRSNSSDESVWQLRLDEDANHPPTLTAQRRRTTKVIIPPDRIASERCRASLVDLEWKDERGRPWKGGLALPERSVNHEPLPLVIQAYWYDPKLFQPDGIAPTAYALQPLASAGFAVLQLRIDDADDTGDRAGPTFVDGIDAVVEKLSREGLIDAHNVGLIGFSRGGTFVNYAAANEQKTRFAAVVAADAGTVDYSYYLTLSLTGYSLAEDESWYGVGNFWENKQGWLAHSPAFNLDRVNAPMMFTLSGYGAPHLGRLLTGHEEYLGLRLLKKPVEFVYFPYGEHQLRRPKEREASLEATVDWMRFWLLGKEDIDPAKAEQYSRWKAMRASKPEK